MVVVDMIWVSQAVQLHEPVDNSNTVRKYNKYLQLEGQNHKSNEGRIVGHHLACYTVKVKLCRGKELIF